MDIKTALRPDSGTVLAHDKDLWAMSERQREYFRRKLLNWKDEILRESRETLTALQTENENHPDLAATLDRACQPLHRLRLVQARAGKTQFQAVQIEFQARGSMSVHAREISSYALRWLSSPLFAIIALRIVVL